MLSLLTSTDVNSQEVVVPIDVQMQLFFKIISFDRNFKSRIKNNITINIVYQKKFRNSLNALNEVLSFFDKNMNYRSFEGFNVVVKPLAIESENDLKNYMTSNLNDIYYICPMRAVNISSISVHSKNNKILSFTGVQEYVEEGISFGFGIKGDKPLIIINLETSKKIGADYSSQLLRLAKVIE